MKNLPIKASSTVKTKNDAGRAVVIRPDSLLKVYGLYVDENGSLYRHVGVEYLGEEYYGYVLEARIAMCEGPEGGGEIKPAEKPGQEPGEPPATDSVAEFELHLQQQGFRFGQISP